MRGFTVVSTIVLVVVVVVVAIAAALLARTVRAAQKINTKAQNIAENGTGINTSTDSVIQLRRTNNLARSILRSADPLEGQLSGIVGAAQTINGLAGSINSTAQTVNTTAGAINTTAGAINTSAERINAAAGEINTSANSINSSAGAINSSAGSISTTARAINTSAGSIDTSVRSIRTSARRIDGLADSILDTARIIDSDVRLINTNLDVTLSLVTAVKGDTADILVQAASAHDTAACIDRKLFGTNGDDGDCRGQPNVAARSRGSLVVDQMVENGIDELSDRPKEEGSTPSDGKDESRGASKPQDGGSTPAPPDPKLVEVPEPPIPGLPPIPGNLPDVTGNLPEPAGTNGKQPSLDELLDQLFPGGTK